MKNEDIGLKIHLVMGLIIVSLSYIIVPSIVQTIMNTFAICGMGLIVILTLYWIIKRLRQNKFE
jgi:hypothetical protein